MGKWVSGSFAALIWVHVSRASLDAMTVLYSDARTLEPGTDLSRTKSHLQDLYSRVACFGSASELPSVWPLVVRITISSVNNFAVHNDDVEVSLGGGAVILETEVMAGAGTRRWGALARRVCDSLSRHSGIRREADDSITTTLPADSTPSPPRSLTRRLFCLWLSRAAYLSYLAPSVPVLPPPSAKRTRKALRHWGSIAV